MSQKILAIDPGTLFSGLCVFDGTQILDFGKLNNLEVLEYIASKNWDVCVVERIACYGMPLGESTLETIWWSGRMFEVAQQTEKQTARIYRKDVKIHLCGNMRAKDSNIIQVLKDRFEPDLEPHKKPKGILKGITADVWQALAIAVFYFDTNIKQNGNITN